MKSSFLLLVIISTFTVTTFATDFPTSTPEARGISSQAILDFIQAAEDQANALHSFMLLRHGHVVGRGWWEPYHADRPHMLYSLSKSFTSTAIGLAVAEGLLSLNDTVISFFPDQTPVEPSNNLKAMRIRDLLAMNSGHELDTTGRITTAQDKTWVEAFLALPVEFRPGTHFVYNSGATFMLSAILQKVSGETVLDYLRPRLFDPLGITDATWESNPQGINMGGWGLKVKTEDIAKLGQLYLQNGVWNGERILTEEWVKAASARQSSNGSNPDSDWEQGYGYQFWRCRHNAYRGDGAFGQYCIVMPDQDAVLAITSGVGDMQTPLNLVWDILLPAMREEPLPEDDQSYEALQRKCSSLVLPVVQGEKSSEFADQDSNATYLFDKNIQGIESMIFDFSEETTITVQATNGIRRIKCGYQTWGKNVIPFMSAASEPVAAAGAWIAPDQYRVKLCAYETPYIQQLDFTFKQDELLFNLEFNVSFGERRWEPLRGRRK